MSVETYESLMDEMRLADVEILRSELAYYKERCRVLSMEWEARGAELARALERIRQLEEEPQPVVSGG